MQSPDFILHILWKTKIFFLVFLVSAPFGAFSEYQTYEATYYHSSLDGNSTVNGDIFRNSDFSAASCDESLLGKYVYLSRWWTGVVVDVNDRPGRSTCERFPNMLDLSQSAFSVFTPLSSGRITDIQAVVLWDAPTKINKSFLPKDTFAHLGIMLDTDIPTVLFTDEWFILQGQVLWNQKMVIFALIDAENQKIVSLSEVQNDKKFRISLRLPSHAWLYTMIISEGQGYKTDKYATISLVDKNTLVYPNLKSEKYTWNPKITLTSMSEAWSAIFQRPSLMLPKNISGVLSLSQWSQKFRAEGNAFILENTSLSLWKAYIHIGWYELSTPSSLDRSRSVTTLYSGSVILDRTHEIISPEGVKISFLRNIANIRFTTPSDYRIRSKYYLTEPNGDVKEYVYDAKYIDPDGYLKKSTVIQIRTPLSVEWSYMLEVVKQDGIAYINTPLYRWRVWSIIKPLTDASIRTISKNIASVRQSNLERLNFLRTKLGREKLTLDPILTTLAQAKVDDMIVRWYEWHADPDGHYIDILAEKIGLAIPSSIGENIWYGSVSHLSLQDGLEESGAHKYNMLSDRWIKVWVGYHYKNGKTYLVQVFGK